SHDLRRRRSQYPEGKGLSHAELRRLRRAEGAALRGLLGDAAKGSPDPLPEELPGRVRLGAARGLTDHDFTPAPPRVDHRKPLPHTEGRGSRARLLLVSFPGSSDRGRGGREDPDGEERDFSQPDGWGAGASLDSDLRQSTRHHPPSRRIPPGLVPDARSTLARLRQETRL